MIILNTLPHRDDIKGLLAITNVYLGAIPYSGATSLLDPLEAGVPPVVVQGDKLRFYAISRNAINGCCIPDPRLIHNNGDWTTGMALHHQGFKIANYTYGVTINDAPRRGIHADKLCLSDGAEQQRMQAKKIAINALFHSNGKCKTR